MNFEAVTTEIRLFLEHMGVLEEIESVDARQGSISYFSVKTKNRDERAPGDSTDGHPQEEDFLSGRQKISVSQMLIGEHGYNLASLEHLLKKIVKKKFGDEYKFTLDVNDYRLRGLEDLKQDIKAAAKEVRLYHKEVPLRPMSSFERRIVHILLAEYPDITTESTGEEPRRKVIIKPFP